MRRSDGARRYVGPRSPRREYRRAARALGALDRVSQPRRHTARAIAPGGAYPDWRRRLLLSARARPGAMGSGARAARGAGGVSARVVAFEDVKPALEALIADVEA